MDVSIVQGHSGDRVEKLIHEQGFPLGLVCGGVVSVVDFTTGLCYKMARMRSAYPRVGDRIVSTFVRFMGGNFRLC
jgi:hypothetical protein